MPRNLGYANGKAFTLPTLREEIETFFVGKNFVSESLKTLPCGGKFYGRLLENP